MAIYTTEVQRTACWARYTSAGRPRLLRRGFTLVELLVVIAIIGLLIAILIPAITSARESARRTQCSNNQRQLGVAFLNREAATRTFPSSMTLTIKGSVSDPALSLSNFVVDLLPYSEETGIAGQFHRDEPFCASTNAPAIASPLAVGLCPSAPSRDLAPAMQFVPSQVFSQAARDDSVLGPILSRLDQEYTMTYIGAATDYAVPIDRESLFPSPVATLTAAEIQTHIARRAISDKYEFVRELKAADVIDGMSKTLILSEVAGRPEHWTGGEHSKAGEPLVSAWADPRIGFKTQIRGDDCFPQCDNNRGLYSFHTAGINVLFADGHVDFLSSDVGSQSLIRTMVTIDGNDSLE